MSQRKAAVVMIVAAALSMTTETPGHAAYRPIERIVIASTLPTEDVETVISSLDGLEPVDSLIEMLLSGPPPIATPTVEPSPPPVATPTVDPSPPPVATPAVVTSVISTVEPVLRRHDVTAACTYTFKAADPDGHGAFVVMAGGAVGTGDALAASTTVRCEIENGGGGRWREFRAIGPVAVMHPTTVGVNSAPTRVCVTAEASFIDGHRVTLPRTCSNWSD